MFNHFLFATREGRPGRGNSWLQATHRGSRLNATVSSVRNPESPPLNAKGAMSGDLPLLPTTSSPGESSFHRFSSLPPPRMMDWSNLGEGPAGMIADLVLANDVADYVRFRAACRPWRQCTADPRAHGILDRRFLPRSWIMLREKVADPARRRLLNVATGQCVRAHLPELRGHDVCAPTVEGLLVLLNRTTHAVRLLNPLTRLASDLPPATALHRLYRDMYEYDWPADTDPRDREDFDDSYRVSGAGLADDATVAVLFSGIHNELLGVVKPGDEQWTLVDQGDEQWRQVNRDDSLSPAISCAGRFYCTTGRRIKMVDTSDDQPPRLVAAAKIRHRLPGIVSTVHLLDNGGELIFLTRSFTQMQRTGEAEDSTAAEARYFMQYNVSRVDLDARKTKPIRDLGGRAVFIGSTRAISVSSLAFPTIRNDSFYLGKDHVVGSYLESIGPYKIVDGTGATEACGFDNDQKDSVPRYGPYSIVDYISWYVSTKDASDSDAEEETSDRC